MNTRFWTVLLGTGLVAALVVGLVALSGLYETRLQWSVFAILLAVVVVGAAAFQASSDAGRPPLAFLLAVPVGVAVSLVVPAFFGGRPTATLLVGVGSACVATLVLALVQRRTELSRQH